MALRSINSRPAKSLPPRPFLDAGAVTLLLLVNAAVCWWLFFTEYTQHMGSIEAAYIGISRYIVEQAPELAWFPLWYGGIPFENTYPPLLHMLVAGIAAAFSVSPALAHHIAGALFYCIGPVSAFLLARRLSGSRALPFIAALTYSLISFSAFLAPSIGRAMGSYLFSRRLDTLLQFGDGPHIAAVALLPLGVLALDIALDKKGPVRTYLAAAALAAVVLTNWLGAFSLAIAIFCYLLARFGEPGWLLNVTRAAAIGALAYALAAPWIPPSNIRDIQRNAQYFIGQYPLGFTQAAIGVLLLGVLAVTAWLFARRNVSRMLRFSLFFFLCMAALVLTYDWFEIHLMPQPSRYDLEMGLAATLLTVFALAPLWSRLPVRARQGLAAALVLFALFQLRTHMRYARELIRSIPIENTVEYQVSTWLDREMPGRRVFATGSVQFWLNAFGSNPQLGGGFGQGVTNPMIPVIHFGIPYTRGDGERSAMWLQLYGVDAVIVSGPDGRDFYREAWNDSDKFRGVLPELWRDRGDAVFGVPRRSQTLAHIIHPSQIVNTAPVNLSDTGPVRPLLEALEDPFLPLAGMIWPSPHEAVIRADMMPGQVLFVQISYHKGWKAWAEGRRSAIRPDALGLMIIEPRCDGPCEVKLIYDGGLEMVLARAASYGAVLLGIVWVVAALRRRAAAA